MTDTAKSEGVIVALLHRFEKLEMPRILELKTKVDKGGTLNEFDLEFLQEMLRDDGVKRLVDQRPDLQGLYARAASLYHEITAKALENEQGKSGT